MEESRSSSMTARRHPCAVFSPPVRTTGVGGVDLAAYEGTARGRRGSRALRHGSGTDSQGRNPGASAASAISGASPTRCTRRSPCARAGAMTSTTRRWSAAARRCPPQQGAAMPFRMGATDARSVSSSPAPAWAGAKGGCAARSSMDCAASMTSPRWSGRRRDRWAAPVAPRCTGRTASGRVMQWSTVDISRRAGDVRRRDHRPVRGCAGGRNCAMAFPVSPIRPRNLR